MDKRYAIFDMDGTLVDSMPIWRGLAEEYLRRCGVTDVRQDLLKKMRHRTMLETAAILIREFRLEGTPESVAAEINAMMTEHYKYDVKRKDGVVEYLEKLKQRGVRMCVASATAKPMVELCMKRLGILGYFEGIYSCVDAGAGKHSPAVYDAAARHMGAKAEEAAVYEDAGLAGRTAKEAGYYLVAVRDETASEEWPELSALADEVILDWREAQ